jgi:4-alpha-glucanotransferase
MLSDRRAGILLHPSSLPGRFGIGDLGEEAERFLHWLAAAGQSVWQILPLGPTGFGNSPYGALSAFAGNPLLISPERLVRDGHLRAERLRQVPSFDRDHVPFEHVARFKSTLLKEAHQNFRTSAPPAVKERFEQFRTHADQRYWLDDFALFMALKEKFGGREWMSWDRALARREKAALEAARGELHDAIDYHSFVQFLFFSQWSELRSKARNLGVEILGDLPIYVALDGADTWSHPELFYLDDDLQPIGVAGVPPDYFSADGQRWGNPLYRWDVMKESGYAWWVERIKANLRLTDLVRLDHFRGFAAYWEVPAEEETARNGKWIDGPGVELFQAIEKELGSLPLIAEDLGTITEDVNELRRAIKAPGMRVLQFAFGDDDNIHLPHHCEEQTVLYTGTHDNDTTRGWFESASEHERSRALTYFGASPGEIAWQLIRAAYASIARLAIVPLQDLFSLGAEARMNTPGDPAGNWGWRARSELFSDQAVPTGLRRLAEITGRKKNAKASS